MTGPLQDLRVLDLTRMLSGPYATMLLADLGADVVKIESRRGDGTRATGPWREGDGPEGLSGYFQSINRGKRSVMLDLKDPADRDRLLALADTADVLVENFTVGVMDRLGLSYETLAERNPRLVYAAVRGFGDPRTGESPYARWPAFDVVAQAMGGLSGITGPVGGPPVKAGPGIGDLFPAALLAVGVLAAVHHARLTGEGQFLDVAMYDAVLSLCERIVYQHSYTGRVPGPEGNGHPLLCPFDVFATKDGWIAVAAPDDAQWRTLAASIGGDALDERYNTNRDRVRHAAEVRQIVGDWLSARTNTEVVALLGGRVPVGPVNDAAAIFADPHVAARRMLASLPQPGAEQPVTVAGQPIKFTRTPAAVERRAPQLGEHNATEIISEWTRR
ncbi:MAG: CoA transferase [Acidimicrobiaceae bacterium]|nr:CoA transferase [Acidimicrobiaceae bacterium]